jgi:hypothetical protein
MPWRTRAEARDYIQAETLTRMDVDPNVVAGFSPRSLYSWKEEHAE